MAARVIHFGEDGCHRVSVLRHAGLTVDLCHTPDELIRMLRTGTSPDAIVISQSKALDPVTAKSLAHSVGRPIPVVLFPADPEVPEDRAFDLVVAPLTRPEDWLDELRKLIRRKGREIQLASRTARTDAKRPVQSVRGEQGPSNRLLASSHHPLR